MRPLFIFTEKVLEVMLRNMAGTDPGLGVDETPCKVICISCRGGLSSLVHLMRCLGVSGFPAEVIHEGEVILKGAWVTALLDGDRVALQNPESLQIEIWPLDLVSPVV